MKTYSGFIFMLTFFTCISDRALAANYTQELSDYAEIQLLLSNDNFAGVTDASRKLSLDARANRHDKVSAQADKLSQASDIKSARELFIPLSKEIIPVAKADQSKNFEVIYCPMKKERWVQKKGPIANPYYGKQMQDCGVREKTSE